MTEEVQLKINDKNGALYIDVNDKHEAMMTLRLTIEE
jgi:hypothetical protein